MTGIQGTLSFEETAAYTVEQLWTLATAELLKALKEDRRIERKPVGIHAPELAEYFSMWANTSVEGGLVAVGVANKGGITGCRCIEIEHVDRSPSADALGLISVIRSPLA